MWFDPALVEAVRDLTPPWLVVLLVLLSFLGSAYFITPAVILTYWSERRERTATWIAIVFGSYALRSLLKSHNSISRPPVDPPLDPALFPALIRPLYAHPAEIATTSFPSGHAMAATVFWGLVVVDSQVGTRRSRLFFATGIVGIVGVSRMAVGAHYLADVVAGIAIGLGFLWIVLVLRRQTSNPVGVTFGVAGLVAALTLATSGSTTAEAVLGASVGAIVAWHAPSLEELAETHFTRPGAVRTLGISVFLTTGVLGTALVTNGGSLELPVLTMVGAVIVFWLPESGIGNGVIPAFIRERYD